MKTQKTDSEVKHAIIKARKERAFEDIKKANELLEHLRKSCDHLETELCTYSTRPGQYWENTEICSICGEVIKIPWEEVVWVGQGELDDVALDAINDEINSYNDGGVSTGLNEDDD